MSDIKAVYEADCENPLERPLFMVPVAAGFPSPAEDYVEGRLDLNKHLVKRLRIKDDKVVIMVENPEYQPIQIENDMEFEVWGGDQGDSQPLTVNDWMYDEGRPADCFL